MAKRCGRNSGMKAPDIAEWAEMTTRKLEHREEKLSGSEKMLGVDGSNQPPAGGGNSLIHAFGHYCGDVVEQMLRVELALQQKLHLRGAKAGSSGCFFEQLRDGVLQVRILVHHCELPITIANAKCD